MGEPARFLSRDSVAEMFDVSASTVDRWVAKGLIRPAVAVGRIKRYDVSELLRQAGQALDHAAATGARSLDPDEALLRAAENVRKDRQAAAGRRHR